MGYSRYARRRRLLRHQPAVRRLRKVEETLRLSQERYRGVVEDLHEMVSRWTPDWRLTFANEAYCRFYGESREDLIGKRFSVPIADSDSSNVAAYLQQLGKNMPRGFIEYRVKVNGACRWIRRSDRAIFNSRGDVAEFQSMSRDITVRKNSEKALLRSRGALLQRVAESSEQLRLKTEMLETLIDVIPVMLCFFRPDGGLTFVNQAFERLVGWSLSELQDGDVMRMCFPDSSMRRQARGHLASSNGIGRDFTLRCRNGADLPSTWAYVKLSDGTHIGIGIDIRKHKETEAALRELSRQTIEALEGERQAVSKELHDSIGASLAALKFALEGRVDAMEPQHQKEVPGEMPFETILAHLAATIKETKRISVRLRPPTLDEFGLLKTIQMHLREFEDFYPEIEVSAQLPIRETDISDQLKLVVYRLIQEGLNNVSKHSGARRVHIGLRRNDRVLVLDMGDDGCGFELMRVLDDPAGGYGLKSMKQRVKICNGRFQIRTAPGKGTAIRAVLPADAV
jgi:PAS domain S-box-containing protein